MSKVKVVGVRTALYTMARNAHVGARLNLLPMTDIRFMIKLQRKGVSAERDSRRSMVEDRSRWNAYRERLFPFVDLLQYPGSRQCCGGAGAQVGGHAMIALPAWCISMTDEKGTR